MKVLSEPFFLIEISRDLILELKFEWTPRRFQKLCYCTIVSKKYKALYIVVKASSIKYGINYHGYAWNFSKLQFHTCNLQFWHRLSLFIIDSLKIVSPKLIVTLSFCLFAEDQSRNLHHKFFKFQNKQARNLVKKKQTTRQEIWADFEKATSKCPKRTQRRERGRPRQSRIKVRESQKLLFLPLHNFSNKRSKKFAYLILQVNLCQKLLFLHQLTHNMMTDCSFIELQDQYMKIPCSEHGENMLCT